MKVKDLIQYLNQVKPEAEVLIKSECGSIDSVPAFYDHALNYGSFTLTFKVDEDIRLRDEAENQEAWEAVTEALSELQYKLDRLSEV